MSVEGFGNFSLLAFGTKLGSLRPRQVAGAFFLDTRSIAVLIGKDNKAATK